MVLLLALVGCGDGGNYLNSELACEHDVFGWWEDDLTHFVDRGTPVDGAANQVEWRLDSDLSYKGVLLGKYNALNGNFEYRNNYAGNYYLKHAATDETFNNFGTVYRNGNMDVRAKIIVEDRNGDTFSYVRRDVRTKCNGTMAFRNELPNGTIPSRPDTVIDYEIVSVDRIKWEGTIVNQAGVVSYGVGSWYSDGRQEGLWETPDGEDNVTTTRKRKTNGSLEVASAGDLGKSGYSFTYDLERKVSGLTIEDEVRYALQTTEERVRFHYERAMDGTGTGTATYASGEACTVSFNGWDGCDWQCDGNSNPSCPSKPAY